MDQITVNLTITEACNLACKYCYIKNKNNYITTDVIDNLYNNIDKIMQLFNGRTFNIDFFGGEPLLNWDIIEYTVNKFKNTDNLAFFCIVSNMLLLDKNKIKFIKENKIGCSWSFDGLWNKDVRIKNDLKTSSFDMYMEKLDLIKEVASGCKCMITPYHMKSNVTIAENFKFMIEELNICPDFSVSRDFDWTDDVLIEFEKQLDEYVKLYIEYCNKGIIIHQGFINLFLADTILFKKTQKRNFSCFAGQNGLTIMPNGDIFPCSRYGTNNICQMGNIFNIDKLHPFEYKERLNPVYFEKCKNCEMYGWCNSGCQYNQQCNNFKPLDCYCKLYKIIYKKALYIYSELKTNREWLRSLHFENQILNNKY